MPYKKYRMVKRRRYRPRYKRKKQFKKAVARVLYSLAEHKWIQGLASATSLTTLTPLESTMNLIFPGNPESGRIGTKMTMLNLAFRYQIHIDPNLAQTLNVRVYIIESLEELDPANLPASPLGLFPTLTQSNSRYKVWYDRSHDMSPNVHEDIVVSKRVALKKHQIRMDGLTNTFLRGKLRIFFVTDNSTANAVAVECEHRVIYNDS